MTTRLARRYLSPCRLGLAMLLAVTSGCAHFSDIDHMPSAFRERLAKHPRWLTVVDFVNEPGDFPPAEVWAVKKWEVVEKRGVASLLKETHSSSLVGLLERLRRGRPPVARVPLGGSVDPTQFFPHEEHGLEARRVYEADDYRFVDLDGRRFQVLVNGGRGRIVFMPAPNDYADADDPWKDRAIGVWTTPFGAESELLAFLREHLEVDERRLEKLRGGPFLHHDLTVDRRVEVVLDPSVPAVAGPAAALAAGAWNDALPKPLFRVDGKSRRRLDRGDCLTSYRVCVRWSGPPDLSASGSNGYTELAFDPQSGLVIGAIVTIVNDDVELPLKPLSAADRQAMLGVSPEGTAGAVLRFSAYDHGIHPEPAAYLQYLISHELGHVLGLGHNFLADASTSVARPVVTVMTYPPFPVAWRVNYIGEQDKRRLALVYGGRASKSSKGGKGAGVPKERTAAELKSEGDALAADYCSTFDALIPTPGDDGIFRKRSRCDVFTVGDAGDWYAHLADQGRYGVFTSYPDLSHLSEDLQRVYRAAAARRGLPPLNVLARLGYVLADQTASAAPSRERVRRYLCARTSDRIGIVAQLRDAHGVTLDCSAAAPPAPGGPVGPTTPLGVPPKR